MKSLLLITLLAVASSAEGCFIIIGKKNGRVLVGNNEDWDHSDAKYWIERPRKRKDEKYATLFFGFKGEFSTAQGGFNEKGLFFDATAVPKLTMDERTKEGKEKAIHPIFKILLKKCATVEEAAALLEKYYIPFIKRVQIVLADSTGAYLILNLNGVAERGKVVDGYRLITNFHVGDKHHFCYRYDSATTKLEKHFENTPDEIAQILSLSHQEFPGATVYSNVYDLTRPSVRTFYNHRFTQSVNADFQKPLDKYVYLEERFSKRMIPVLIKIHKKKGATEAISFFKTELQKRKSAYECDVEQLSDLTSRLLNQQHFADALAVAAENSKLFPESDRAHEQLAKSLMYNGKIEEGKREYEKALSLNPSNRWGTCVLRQFQHAPAGNTTLTLKGYGQATLVTVAGEFNEWQAMQNICFKNNEGNWECKVSLPPGLYSYRFVVDGKWIDDPSNTPSKEIQKGFFVSELTVQ